MLKTLISKSVVFWPPTETHKLFSGLLKPLGKEQFFQYRFFYCSSVFLKHRHLNRKTSIPVVSSDLKQSDNEEVMGAGDKILKVKLARIRLDAVLKAGLNISRNKIEKAFYDDRIRLNGERAKKKSQLLEENDEIDIVRGTNKLNPSFIDVSRVEIMDILSSGSQSEEFDEGDSTDDEEEGSTKTPVVLKRYKNLTIQNYSIPWKGGPSDER